MPIRSQNPVLLHGEQMATVSSLREELGATFSEAVQSGPIGSLSRMADLDEAEQGIADDPMTLSRVGTRIGRGADSPKLTRDAAAQRVKDAGLDGLLSIPASGMRQRTVDILIERKRAELRRRTILQQSPGGAGRTSARLASAFAGSLVDPTNIALAFVPVVGEARYAALLARAGSMAGRTGVRLGVGAAEGTVGAAIAEPLNYYANVQQQADYDAYDAMTNIAGGAFFGSALHAGAGLFGDMLRPGRWAQKPQRVNPDADPGRVVTPGVETAPARTNALEYDPTALALQRERDIVLDRLSEGRPLTRERATAQALESLRPDIEAGLLARASGVADKGDIAAAKADLTAVTRELDGLDAERRGLVKDINGRPGVTRKQAEKLADEQLAERRADLEGRKSRAEAQIAGNKDASDAVAELSALRRGEVPEAWRSQVDAEADRLLGGDGQNALSSAVRKAIDEDPFGNVRPYLAQLPADVQQGALRMALAQMATGRPIDVTPALLAHHGDVQGAAVAAQRNAGELAGADRYAAQQADLRLQDAPKADTVETRTEAANEAEAAYREQAAQSGLDEDAVGDLLEEGQQAVREAASFTKALKIAALCALRT